MQAGLGTVWMGIVRRRGRSGRELGRGRGRLGRGALLLQRPGQGLVVMVGLVLRVRVGRRVVIL